MSFLQANKKIERKTEKNFLGFAPINFNNKIPSLHATEKEISVSNIFSNSNVFISENATKTNFLDIASRYKIIHLATHANITENPKIFFKNDTLKLHELYTQKINTDLVTLSACETNLGKLKKGEGVLSLARGFFHAGANSVISSLWKVNDNTTSFLMKNFYENLKSKQTKTEALNNAKRKYLQEHTLSEKSPYYWASFVLIGDNNKTFESNNYFYFLFILITLITIIFIFFKKRG